MHPEVKGLNRGAGVNFSIRTKLLLIYLLCVLVPIIAFSYMFYTSVMESMKKEKLILFNQALDRIALSIKSSALDAMALSNAIYPDEKMYDYLNTEYADKRKSMEDFNSYLKDAWKRILPYNTNIVLFAVYTDNDTILSSSNLRRIELTVMDDDWYIKYKESNESSFFVNHIDELVLSASRTKLVSYIRKLNYVRNSKYSHILKVTYRPEMLDKILKSETLPGDSYIVNGSGLIVAQTNKSNSAYSNTEFMPFSAVIPEKGRTVIEKPVDLPEGWRVVCILDKDFMQNELKAGMAQIFLLIFCIAVFASIIIFIIASSLYRRIHILVDHMARVEKGDYNLIPDKNKGGDEVGLLISSMNNMLVKIRSLIEDVYKAKIRETQLELLKNQAELKALQGQVNPHFLFNVLETIRMKSYMKNEFETARVIRNMSKIFRKLLMWNKDMIPLGEEISFIKEYLEIQQYRFEDELEYEIDADDRLSQFKIPKMTLQTFVDNACEHGFSDSSGLKKIKVAAFISGGKAVLSVFDNGKGMPAELADNIRDAPVKGIGIKNVLGRLDLYFGSRYKFSISSSPGEFTEILLTFDYDANAGG